MLDRSPRLGRRLLAGWLLCTVAMAASATAQSAELVRDGQPVGRIVTAAEPHAAETFAAEELQIYLERISGAKLPITASDEAGDGPAIIVGRHPVAAHVIEQLDERHGDKYGAIAVVGEGDRLYVVGRSHTATSWAAWDWLESLGVRWIMPGEHGKYIPERRTIAIEPAAKYDAPRFAYRGPNTNMAPQYGGPPSSYALEHGISTSELFGIRLRLNSNIAINSPADAWAGLGSGHSYQHYLPVGKYYEEHPEWFNLIGGKRLSGGEWQVCFTNREAAQQFSQNMLATMDSFVAKGVPVDRMRIFVSPNDWDAICDCENCQPLVDKDGSGTSLVVNFANLLAEQIRRKYPNVRIVFYAYDNYSTVPDHVKPGPGVYPELTFWTAGISFGANHAHPMFSEANAKYRDAFAEWARISDGISSHTYDGHYRWFTPWPKLTQIAHDIPVMAKMPGVYGLYSESHLHWGTQLLNFYLQAKLLWDPELDVEALLDDYCAAAFGPAGPSIREYFDVVQQRMDELGYVCGYTVEIPNLLTPEVVKKCDALVDQASHYLDQMDEDTRWRTELVIAAWRHSAAYAEAARLFVNSSDPMGRQRILDLIDQVRTFADTEQGRWAFEHRIVEYVLPQLDSALRLDLHAMPPGEHSVYSEAKYGGAIKFFADVTGFQPGMWGYSLPVHGDGTIELPLHAAEGHTIRSAKIRWRIANGGRIAARLLVVGEDGKQHLLTHDPQQLGQALAVPETALGGQTLTFRLQMRNRHYAPQIVIAALGLDVTVE